MSLSLDMSHCPIAGANSAPELETQHHIVVHKYPDDNWWAGIRFMKAWKRNS